MQKWSKRFQTRPKAALPPQKAENKDSASNYAAIDLGTNSCRLVIATPTPTSFRVLETFSKITCLGEGIIQNNELSKDAVRRTVAALKVCRGVMNEYAPIIKQRFVATAACRRAKNCHEFVDLVKREADIPLEIISSKEEARLAVVGCVPLLNRRIKRALIFDIGGGSSEISLARITSSGRTFIEGFVSLPYGVVTVSEAFPKQEMTDLAYDSIVERTQKLLEEFDACYGIKEGIQKQEIQVIGTSGTVTVLGAVHLNLPRYNRQAVDGLHVTGADLAKVIHKIKKMGDEGRCRHPCIGPQTADLTIAGCAIIEGLIGFWNVSEITVADRGIREGILLDLMHHEQTQKSRHEHPRRWRNRLFQRRRKYVKPNSGGD